MLVYLVISSSVGLFQFNLQIFDLSSFSELFKVLVSYDVKKIKKNTTKIQKINEVSNNIP